MEIKELNANELANFIQSDEFNNLANIPISKPRALSHINNPRLDENDILLFLAYDNNKFVGYLGAIPDYIFADNIKQKVAWLSCMWVDKSMRGKGIAPLLLDKANKTWESNLLIVNFTNTAKSSYDKINAFTELKTYNGMRFYRRLDSANLIVNKNKKYKKYKTLLKIVDFNFNIFNDIKNIVLNKKIDKNISLEYVNFIDKKTENFISNFNKNNLSQRAKKELDWIIKYPWILSAVSENLESKKYEFSVSNKRFLALNIKVFYSKNLVGFLMLNVRDNHLRIPYLFVEQKNIKIISQVILEQIKKLKIDYITIFNKDLIVELEKSSQFFYKKVQKRIYLITEKLKSEYKNITNKDCQDGEGDSAFT